MNIDKQASELLQLLRSRHLTLASAESCTGGNIARCITAIPGASDVFQGAIVAYSNNVKHRVLNVRLATLESFGAVSTNTISEMLMGVVRTIGADCAVATSGIAGPGGGSPDKPVGTVCIGAVCCERVMVDTFHFTGSRTEIVECASRQALAMLRELLLSAQPTTVHSH